MLAYILSRNIHIFIFTYTIVQQSILHIVLCYIHDIRFHKKVTNIFNIAITKEWLKVHTEHN